MLQHGWTLRTLCQVKQASHKKRQILYDFTHEKGKVVKLIDKEVKMMVSKGWGEGKMSMEFHFYKMESSRDLLHNKVNILTAELYSLKWLNI